MFKNLRIFNKKSDYTSKKGEFEYPTCSYVEAEDWVYFMEPVPTVNSFNVTLSYSTTVLDASGGTATPYYSFTQDVSYDNGTSKTFTGNSTYPHSEAVIEWVNANEMGVVSADTKGTVTSNQTIVSTPIIKVKLNGAEATATTTIYQQENKIVSSSVTNGDVTYSDITKGTITNATIPASGSDTSYHASATNGTQIKYDGGDVTSYTYTSTATREDVEGASQETLTIIPNISSISATANTRGTATGNVITITSATVTWSANGKSVSDTMSIFQAKNGLVDTWSSGGTYSYGNLVKGSVSNATISAAGGSKTVTPTTGTQTWSKTATHAWSSYTSTAKASAVTEQASSGTYTITPSPTSFNASADSRGTVTGDKLTIKTQVITWSSDYTNESLTSTGYIYQEANNCTTSITYTYGNITKGSISNKTIPASGGNATATVGNGSQGRTGVTTSAYTSNAELTAITVNDTHSVTPNITQLYGSANSRGTVTGDKLTVTSSTVTWSLNGKSASDTVYVYQEANTRSVKSTAVTYSDITKGTITATPSSIEYTGGTSVINATKGSQTWEEITTYSYTSKEESTAKTNNGTIEVTPTVNPTALTFTLAEGTEDICKTATATWSANGKSATDTVRVCQSAVVVTGQSTDYTYGAITKGTITNATIPASGSSTNYTASASNGSQPYTAITYNDFSDGHREEVSRTTGTNLVSASPSSISATASTRGTVTGSQLTIKSSGVTWSANGKSATDTMYIYQQANEVTSTTTARTYTWGNVTAGTITDATVPASGGTKSASAGNGSQKYTAYTATTYYYTSKASDSANTNSSSSTSSITPDYSSTSATGSHLGTTTSTTKTLASRDVKWSGGGSKSASGRMYVYQEANVKTYKTSGVTQGSVTYGDVTAGTVTNATIPASGSSSNYTASASNGSQTSARTDTPWSSYTYTSTSSSTSNGQSYVVSGTVVVTPSPSSISATASTRGTVTGSQLTIKSSGVTWASKDGTTSKNKTNTMYVYQGKNEITGTTYGTPSGLTLTVSDIAAGGGTVSSGTIGGTCKQKVTSSYTSNAISSQTLTITTYSGSYGTKVTAGTLGTTVTTAKKKIGTLTYTYTANNKSNTCSATVYQGINSKSQSGTSTSYGSKTYGNVTAGTITNATVAASGGTKTATAGNGSQSWTRTATPYTAYTYTSGATGKTDGSSYTDSGNDTVSPSTSSISATGSNLQRTEKAKTTLSSTTVTWKSLDGTTSKNKTDTMYVYQQANVCTLSYGTPSGVTLTVSDIPAKGGTISTGTLNSSYCDQKRTSSYTSNASSSETITILYSGSYGTKVTAGTLGTTVTTAKKKIGTLTYTYTANNKSNTCSATVYQGINSKSQSGTSTSYGSKTYGNVTAGTITNATVAASGGTKTATAGNGSQSWTRTATPYTAYTYTSGATGKTDGSSYTDSGNDTVSPSTSSISATGSNLQRTEKAKTTLSSTTVTWKSLDGTTSKNKTDTMYVYQQANSVRYTGGEWANSDAYNTLTSCRTYRVNNNVYQTYTSGVQNAVSSSTFKWSCDGDVTGSGSGTSGNFCPGSPYGGYGSGHIEVKTSDGMYIIASATVTVQA